MLNDLWSLSFGALDATLGIVAFYLLLRSRALSVFWPMLPITLWKLIPFLLLLLIRKYRVLTPAHAYDAYFFTYYTCFALAALCSAALTYTIFNEALRPLKGLQSLGIIIYRWTSAISVAIAVGAMLTPTTESYGFSVAASQLQRASGIIVLSLILFVGFAIRPLGLSWRSRIFGVSLGVGLAAAVNFYEAGYSEQIHTIYGADGVVSSVVGCVAELIWIYYLWSPEPQRKFVLLPTTSPFHAWNQISEILGHDPGYVAIGGIPPDAFAPAELDIFERASRNMALADAGDVGTQFLSRTHYSVSGKPRVTDGSARSLSDPEASDRLSSAWKGTSGKDGN